MQPIDRIRLAAKLTTDTWLGDCFRRYLDGAHLGLTLDQCFGLQSSRGKPAWWRIERRRERDGFIEVLSDVYCPTLSVNAKAKKIHQLADHYEATAWNRDKYADAMPTSYTNTLREILYCAFRLAKEARSSFPQERQLRRILAKQGHVLKAKNISDN